MNAKTINLIKYILIFLVIVGLGIAVGLFWSQNTSLDKKITKFEAQVDSLKQHYKTDSLIFIKHIDSLNKIAYIQDSTIKAKLINIKNIESKYNAERQRIKGMNADSTLNYFKSQSEISNDW